MMTSGTRKAIVRLCGVLMIAVGVGAALLPLGAPLPERLVIGGLLTVAGVIDIAAEMARRRSGIAGKIAAGATLVAGLRLVLDPSANFFTIFNLVILWLVVRSGSLAFSARSETKPFCNWVYMAAAVDFILALLLLMGLPMAVIIYGIFGPTSELIATFAWILSASFIAAAVLLLSVAPHQCVDAGQPG